MSVLLFLIVYNFIMIATGYVKTYVLFLLDCSFIVGAKPSQFSVGVRVVIVVSA